MMKIVWLIVHTELINTTPLVCALYFHWHSTYHNALHLRCMPKHYWYTVRYILAYIREILYTNT